VAATTRRGGLDPRQDHEQRHPDQVVIERGAVPEPAALHELLAVVGHGDDGGVVEEPAVGSVLS
jgi:hypothetical protein